MTLVRVNPRNKVQRSNSIFDNFFNELKYTGDYKQPTNHFLNNRPSVNILETGDGFRIELSAPGLDKNDFAIGIEKDILTIEANKEVKEQEGEKFIKRGFDFSNFKRTFRLPETIDVNNVKASFENGILSLFLAKKEEAKEQPPRMIEIS
jgi:HSP20 family protein